MKKILVIILVTFIAFTGCSVNINGGDFSFDGSSVSESPYSFDSYESFLEVTENLEDDYKTIQREVESDLDDVEQIIASVVSEDVIIIYEERETVYINYFAVASKSLDERKLKFTTEEGTKTSLEVSWNNLVGVLSGMIEVHVPMTYEKDLSGSSVSGDVTSEYVNANHVFVNVISGEIRLEDVTCDEIELNAISGDIYIESLDAKQLDASVISGDIQLGSTNETCDMSLNSISGDIVVSGVVNHRIDLKTTSGDLRVDVKADLDPSNSSKSYEGTVGSGKATFDAKSISGNIVVK